MPWFRVADFATSNGAIADLPPQSVPPNIFTDVNNIVFADGAVEKAPGISQTFGTPPIAPYFLLSGQDNAGNVKLFIVGLTKIYSYSAGSYTNVTRASGGDYSASGVNDWTGGILHGVPFLNNPEDTPQSWDATSGKFVNLPNWPSGYTCATMRAFKNHLIALDINNGTTRFPHNVLWSHPADPGAVPGTNGWNVADPTKDAGETPLSETAGYIVDGLSLGNQFVIYKEDSIYLMRYAGPPFIFSFQMAVREAGVLAKNCVAEIPGGHVVLAQNDVLLFNGQSTQSIADKRWRREIFTTLSSEAYQKAFVVALPGRNEVWCCIPSSGNAPDFAFVWNWKNNSWTKRDLPNVQSIVWAFPPAQTAADWDTDSQTWDADTSPWSSYLTLGKVGILASPATTEIFTLGTSELSDDQAMHSYAEHLSFDFADAQKPESSEVVKHVSKIRPRIIAEPGVVLTFEVGTQMFLNDAVNWGPAQQFTVGTTEELCLGANGRYISWRVSAALENPVATWRLEAIDFLIQRGGKF